MAYISAWVLFSIQYCGMLSNVAVTGSEVVIIPLPSQQTNRATEVLLNTLLMAILKITGDGLGFVITALGQSSA